MWREASSFFMKEKYKPQHMNLKKFYAEEKFGLLIDLRSIHGSGTRPMNTTDGGQLEIERDAKGSGTLNYHVYVIVDVQFNIVGRELESGSWKYSLQRAHRGADQLGEDAVPRGPAMWPFVWQVRLHRAHLPDIRLQQITLFALPRKIRGSMSSSASSTRSNLGYKWPVFFSRSHQRSHCS